MVALSPCMARAACVRSCTGRQMAGAVTCRTCASAAWFTGALGRPPGACGALGGRPRACGRARMISATASADTALCRLLTAARLRALLVVTIVGASVALASRSSLSRLTPLWKWELSHPLCAALIAASLTAAGAMGNAWRAWVLGVASTQRYHAAAVHREPAAKPVRNGPRGPCHKREKRES